MPTQRPLLLSDDIVTLFDASCPTDVTTSVHVCIHVLQYSDFVRYGVEKKFSSYRCTYTNDGCTQYTHKLILGVGP